MLFIMLSTLQILAKINTETDLAVLTTFSLLIIKIKIKSTIYFNIM